MYIPQSAQASTTTNVSSSKRHSDAGSSDLHPLDAPHNGYAPREVGTGYGRSSGYAAPHGYRGPAYVKSVMPSLFRFN